MDAAFRAAILILSLSASGAAQAVDYRCTVEKKFDSENVYSQAHLQKYRPSVLVEERGTSAVLSRCSFAPSAPKVTCDRYEADKIIFDKHVKIKKYYYFRGQFDMQIFPNLSFVENNGRGSVAFGTCIIVAP